MKKINSTETTPFKLESDKKSIFGMTTYKIIYNDNVYADLTDKHLALTMANIMNTAYFSGQNAARNNLPNATKNKPIFKIDTENQRSDSIVIINQDQAVLTLNSSQEKLSGPILNALNMSYNQGWKSIKNNIKHAPPINIENDKIRHKISRDIARDLHMQELKK